MLFKAISIADHDECGLAVDAFKADLTTVLAHLCHASVAQSTIVINDNSLNLNQWPEALYASV